jgi:hypothetical protein
VDELIQSGAAPAICGATKPMTTMTARSQVVHRPLIDVYAERVMRFNLNARSANRA